MPRNSYKNACVWYAVHARSVASLLSASARFGFLAKSALLGRNGSLACLFYRTIVPSTNR